MADFDTALAELQGIIVDLDGDGVPDAQIPQSMVPQGPQNAMQVEGSASAAPQPNAMSPGMAAVEFVRSRAPQELQSFVEQLPANAAMMAAGPVLGAAGRAAMAYPKIAAGIGAATGLLTSTTEAGQPSLTKSQKRQMQMEQQRGQIEADRRRQEIEAEATAAAARGEAEARTAVERQRKEAELAEYQSQVGRAEMARDNELSRERRFSDTAGGKIMDAMGGWAPAVAGLAVGAMTRGASGPGGVIKNYILPGALGATGGIAAANVPLAYDSLYTDPDNPEKAAYGAYARELPPTHPRKQEFSEYAQGLPSKNPVRENASDELYDTTKLAERAIMGGVEGLGGGLVGADAVRIGGRVADGISGLFRSKPNAMQPGAASAEAAPAATTRVVRKIIGKDGVARHHDENGDFTSVPSAKK